MTVTHRHTDTKTNAGRSDTHARRHARTHPHPLVEACGTAERRTKRRARNGDATRSTAADDNMLAAGGCGARAWREQLTVACVVARCVGGGGGIEGGGR